VGVRINTTVGNVGGAFENVAIDGMTSHGIEGVANCALAMRNVEASRCGGSGFRSAAASVNFAVENSVSSGNNVGFEAIAGNLRISNSAMFFNNTNCTNTVLSAGNNRSAGNTITNNPTPGGMTIH
jgi:hypothetical protein